VKRSSLRTVGAILVVLVVLLLALAVVWLRGRASAQEKRESMQVTLSVYSGRPNPTWSLTPRDADYAKVVRLIAELKTSSEPVFKYDEWNRLGYASFYITTQGRPDRPQLIHIWRDMAYVVPKNEGKPLYALGATPLYDLLVAEAEKQGQKQFFVNYHKTKQ
jgi:hypothetical protein